MSMATNQTRALITGGSTGLGAAFVDALGRHGACVLSLDIAEPKSTETNTIGFSQLQNNQSPKTLIADLSDRAALDAILPDIIASGPYHWLVLNAGINATGPFEHVPIDAMLRLVRLNAEAPMVIASRLLDAGALAQGGHIVFISSLSRFTGYPGAAAYAASKDALAVFAHSIRKAAKAKGVYITTALPGPLKTDHADRHAPTGAKAESRMEPAIAARLILADAAKSAALSIPGAQNKLAAMLGRIAPAAMTRLMRRIIFEKLDRSVF
jgi:short-subunit dehydrogenase